MIEWMNGMNEWINGWCIRHAYWTNFLLFWETGTATLSIANRHKHNIMRANTFIYNEAPTSMHDDMHIYISRIQQNFSYI